MDFTLFTDETDVFTVSQLTKNIKVSLETNFSYIKVEGEISNFKKHSSGHFYFTLKDEFSQLSCVMWKFRTQYLKTLPKDGTKIIATGKITLYEARGSYQLDCESIKISGIGELQQQFELLKQKLFQEGLFDQKYKKTIPKFPNRIGIVTSETGAAIQDMIKIISHRFPIVEIILYPVKVQGIDAAKEISDAINYFNKIKNVDVLIIGRGGGSLEDLFAFNEEIIARTIFKSDIPIISAVGHEIDFTISDFVADVRASTPSNAAEIVVPNKFELIQNISNQIYYLKKIADEKISINKKNVKNIFHSYLFKHPFGKINQFFQQVDELKTLNEKHVQVSVERKSQKLTNLFSRINSLNPKNVLKRGYAIVSSNNNIISSSKILKQNDIAEIQFHDGQIQTTIK